MCIAYFLSSRKLFFTTLTPVPFQRCLSPTPSLQVTMKREEEKQKLQNIYLSKWYHKKHDHEYKFLETASYLSYACSRFYLHFIPSEKETAPNSLSLSFFSILFYPSLLSDCLLTFRRLFSQSFKFVMKRSLRRQHYIYVFLYFFFFHSCCEWFTWRI